MPIEESSKIVGQVTIHTGTTGSTIQVNQGYGQAYFYDNDGTGAYTVQDLSGNAIGQLWGEERHSYFFYRHLIIYVALGR